MTRILRTTCIGLLMGLIGVFQAQAQVPQPPEIAARAYLLVDLTAHQVLAELDAASAISYGFPHDFLRGDLIRQLQFGHQHHQHLIPALYRQNP
jgi:hypothetical protein